MPQVSMCVCDTAVVSNPHKTEDNFDPSILYVGSKKKNNTCEQCHKRCYYGRDYISLLKFDRISFLPHDCDIVRATLHVYVRELYNPFAYSKENKILVYSNLEDFEGPNLCWQDKPKHELEVDGILTFGSNYAHGYASCDITELAVDWHKGLQPNFGISLTEASENAKCIMLDSKCAAHPPYITIDYLQRHQNNCCCFESSEHLKNEFVERIFNINSSQLESLSPYVKASDAERVSFFVKNNGETVFEANLQFSPNGIDYLDDQQILTVAPGELVFIAPTFFAKFMRVHIKNTAFSGNITAKIWWQIQTRDYSIL